MNFIHQSALLVTMVCMSSAFTAYSGRDRSAVLSRFVVASLVLSAWALFYFIGELFPHRPYNGIHVLLTAWLSPVILPFLQELFKIRQESFPRFLTRLSFWTALLFNAGFLVEAYYGGSLGPSWDPEVGYLFRYLNYFSPSYILIQIFYLFFMDQQIRPSFPIRNRSWIYIFTGVVLVTTSMDHMPWAPRWLPVVGNILLCALIFIFGKLIQQKKLIDISPLLEKVVTLPILSLLMTGVFTWIAILAIHDFKLFFFDSIFVSYLLLSFLQPLTAFSKRLTDRILKRKPELLDLVRESFQAESFHGQLAAFYESLNRVSGLQRLVFYLDQERRYDSLAPSSAPRWLEVREKFSNPTVPEILVRGDRGQQKLFIETECRVALRVPIREGTHQVFLFMDLPEAEWLGLMSYSELKSLFPWVRLMGETDLRERELRSAQNEDRLVLLGQMASAFVKKLQKPLLEIENESEIHGARKKAARASELLKEFVLLSKPYQVENRGMFDLNETLQKIVVALRAAPGTDREIQLESSCLTAKIHGDEPSIHETIRTVVKFAESRSRDSSPVRVDLYSDASHTKTQEPYLRVVKKTYYTVLVEDGGEPLSSTEWSGALLPIHPISLFNSRAVLEAHGGDLRMEPNPEKGNRYYLRIPTPELPIR